MTTKHLVPLQGPVNLFHKFHCISSRKEVDYPVKQSGDLSLHRPDDSALPELLLATATLYREILSDLTHKPRRTRQQLPVGSRRKQSSSIHAITLPSQLATGRNLSCNACDQGRLYSSLRLCGKSVLCVNLQSDFRFGK